MKTEKITFKTKTMKPSNFTSLPMGSVLQKSESETIARNIMVILSRRGDIFPETPLIWEEYKAERLKDGNFSEREQGYFEQVNPYCRDAHTAELFCKGWGE